MLKYILKRTFVGVFVLAIVSAIVFGIFFNQEIQNFSFSTDAPKMVNSNGDDPAAPIKRAQVIVDTVAVLTKSVGVRWEDSSQFRADLGDTLEPSTLKLANGLVQVEFLQGATVVLEGPVDFADQLDLVAVRLSQLLRVEIRLIRAFELAFNKLGQIAVGIGFGAIENDLGLELLALAEQPIIDTSKIEVLWNGLQ